MAPVATEPVAAEKRAAIPEAAASAEAAAVDAPAAEPAEAEEPAAAEAAAAEAAKPEAALPQRYDVDEVVALAVDPSTFYVYWEVRPTTFAHRMAGSPGGSLALRVVAITPGWDGPIVETRDIHIDALFGDRFIHHVRPRADVRVSVGWIDEDRFDPIAVGAEVSAPRAFVAAGAPATPGAPLDLSEGLHGARSGAARAVELFARSPRAAERIAQGWRPRELQGTVMAGAAGVTEWIWAPGPETMTDADATSLPFTFGPVAGVERAGSGEGPSATGARWGGASEGAPRWGGASEGAPRWGGASEHAVR